MSTTRPRGRGNPGRAALLAGAIALALGGGAVPVAFAGQPGHARAVPTVVRQVAGPNAVLVASLSRPEGVWQVWESRPKRDVYDYVLQPGRAPQNIAGGQCPALKKRAVVSLCLWGKLDEHFDVALGRIGARAASLEARTADGTAVRVAQGRGGIYLAISSHQRPATTLIARDARGTVIARRHIGLPGGT